MVTVGERVRTERLLHVYEFPQEVTVSPLRAAEDKGRRGVRVDSWSAPTFATDCRFLSLRELHSHVTVDMSSVILTEVSRQSVPGKED